MMAAFTSADMRAQRAALAVRPPDEMDPRDVKVVQEAARKAEAVRRGGVDIVA
jgi:hypothetical protein